MRTQALAAAPTSRAIDFRCVTRTEGYARCTNIAVEALTGRPVARKLDATVDAVALVEERLGGESAVVVGEEGARLGLSLLDFVALAPDGRYVLHCEDRVEEGHAIAVVVYGAEAWVVDSGARTFRDWTVRWACRVPGL